MQPSAISPPPIRKTEEDSGVAVRDASEPMAPNPNRSWSPSEFPLSRNKPLKRTVPESVQSPPLLAVLKTIGAERLFVTTGPDPE